MKKIILGIMLVTTQANAICLDVVLESMRSHLVAEQSVEQKECILSTVEANAMQVLCTDGWTVSREFKRYLSYQKENKELLQKFAQARSTQNHAEAAMALREMRSLGFEWSAGGYRSEINPALVAVMEADYHCRRN